MQKENLFKFDFDFNKVYKKIITITNKIATNRSSSLDNTRYYYLDKRDFIQDTFDITLKHLKDNDKITEDHFLGLFWSNWKIMRLRSFNNRDPRVREYKNFLQLSKLTPEENIRDYNILQTSTEVNQPNLDQKLLVDKIDSNFPTIQSYLEGYSFAEGGRQEGISRKGYSLRFHKEVEILKRMAHV